MKITLLAFLLFTTLSFGQAIKFPYPFKMNHVYQECSACHNVAYHRWSVLAGQNFPSPILKDAAQEKAALKNYSESIKNTFSGTLSPQDQAETECQMTRTGKHAWLEKSKSEPSQISRDDFDKMKIKKDKDKIQEEKNKLEHQKEDNLNLILKKTNELRVEGEKASNLTDAISKYTAVLIEDSNWCKLYGDFAFDGKRILFEHFNDFMLNNYSNDVSKLSWVLIVHKDFEKAYQLLNNYVDNRKICNCGSGDENYINVLKNMTHAILFTKRDESRFWELQKILIKEPNFYDILIQEYNYLNNNGITDPRISEIINKLKLMNN